MRGMKIPLNQPFEAVNLRGKNPKRFMEESMKRKQFASFAVMAVAVIITLAGCDLFPKTKFPSEFRGTWKREDASIYTSTRTFTATAFRQSNQGYDWVLKDVSGDTYTLESSRTGNTTVKTIRLVNGKLVISGCFSYLLGEDYCNGTWIKQ